MPTPAAPDSVEKLLGFIDAAPTAFHATEAICLALAEAGFVRLPEREAWSLVPGGRYVVTRNQSSVVAFRLGSASPVETGFRIACAHTDSPSLKLKTASETVAGGCVKVAVEVYGGPILGTWLDRPLGIGGRVMVRGGDGCAARVCRLPSPAAIVPNVAVHLNREVNKGFEYNAQKHLAAVLAGSSERPEAGLLRAALGEALSVSPDALGGMDLFLYDAQPAGLTGIRRDLVSAPRLDNLAMCHAILSALLASTPGGATAVALLHDNEEVGSRALQAADSSFARDVLTRIVAATDGVRDGVMRAAAGSFLVSADAAHAVHPNFTDKHDKAYAPVLNGGPVIKSSASVRYSTTAPTATRFEELCRAVDVEPQWLIGRSDMKSGSTIGPMTSALLGIPAVDVGNPLLAMHSIRETAGVADHAAMVKVLTRLFGE